MMNLMMITTELRGFVTSLQGKKAFDETTRRYTDEQATDPKKGKLFTMSLAIVGERGAPVEMNVGSLAFHRAGLATDGSNVEGQVVTVQCTMKISERVTDGKLLRIVEWLRCDDLQADGVVKKKTVEPIPGIHLPDEGKA